MENAFSPYLPLILASGYEIVFNVKFDHSYVISGRKLRNTAESSNGVLNKMVKRPQVVIDVVGYQLHATLEGIRTGTVDTADTHLSLLLVSFHRHDRFRN